MKRVSFGSVRGAAVKADGNAYIYKKKTLSVGRGKRGLVVVGKERDTQKTGEALHREKLRRRRNFS